ncbi:TPA: adhesin, partial [Haemophilus influenzae]
GHDLFINDGTTVDAKEWLLDPDNVSIDAEGAGRNGTSEDDEYMGAGNSADNPKRNKEKKTTLTNTTLEKILKGGVFVNITARNTLKVNSTINIGANSHLILWSEKNNNSGVQVDGDITSNGGNLTIYSSGWVDVHKNITLNTGHLNITTKKETSPSKTSRELAT